MYYSVIIPLFNRPDEIKELLESLTRSSLKEFEVIVVEDGSSINSERIIEEYSSKLNIIYIYQANSGPGLARNRGAEAATGDYLIFLDSDTITPPNYLKNIDDYLSLNRIDAFGGPDAAMDNFSDIQKAITFSMTSFFTTGGIRGGKGGKLDKFFPRSFNMGISTEIFKKLGGFSKLRFGEDIDLSYRIVKSGYKTALIQEAFVYHKRRTKLKSFLKQVFFSGMARVNLSIRHKGTLKLVHLLPSLFVLGCIILIILRCIMPLLILSAIWFLDSLIKYKSLRVAAISVITSFIQLAGYGSGFMYGVWKRVIIKEQEDESYKTKFF